MIFPLLLSSFLRFVSSSVGGMSVLRTCNFCFQKTCRSLICCLSTYSWFFSWINIKPVLPTSLGKIYPRQLCTYLVDVLVAKYKRVNLRRQNSSWLRDIPLNITHWRVTCTHSTPSERSILLYEGESRIGEYRDLSCEEGTGEKWMCSSWKERGDRRGKRRGDILHGNTSKDEE